MSLSDIYLWLAYSRVTTRKINGLLENFSPQRLWDDFSGENKYNLDDRTFSALKRARSEDYIESVKQYLAVNHIDYVTRADDAYPLQLNQKEVDPPPTLFYKGDVTLLKTDAIAVVGTRKVSQYGKYATEKITSELCKRFTIVSGLATGVDGLAHTAALNAGGKTIAVLGSGLFNATPTSNLKLFDEIAKYGLVCSEYTPDTHATEYTFPQRNRIISGLSKAVLVVEAAERSGSLITSSCALEQGRDVFAVPGDIDKIRSVGANKLIKQGAAPVTEAQDIFDFYGVEMERSEKPMIELDFTQNKIVQVLSEGERSFDELVGFCGVAISDLNVAISQLLMFGVIRQKAKNIYCLQ